VHLKFGQGGKLGRHAGPGLFFGEILVARVGVDERVMGDNADSSAYDEIVEKICLTGIRDALQKGKPKQRL
jgi:hypothetical protein